MKMTYEEARHFAMCLKNNWAIAIGVNDVGDFGSIALDCIEKQIPKKPIHEHLNFYCPNCKNWLLWDDAEPNDNDLFCPKCGQKIDWSDENVV